MKRAEPTAVNSQITDNVVDTTATSVPEESAQAAEVESIRNRAKQLLSERRFAEARKALEEADALEAGHSDSLPGRVLAAVRYPLSKLPRRKKEAAPDAVPMSQEERAAEIVSLHSKLAVAAGVVPGGLLNYGAILAVQVTMVWRIANVYGHHTGRNKIRGMILSLIGSAVPTAVGGGVMYNIVRIPAVLVGTVAGFVVTPILAYAMTQAVGNTFIMHFQSGGTLLTFDAKKFREYCIKEFQEASAAPAA